MKGKGLRIIKITILFCLALVMLAPVLAKEINEKKYKAEDFLEVINVLPLSEGQTWIEGLPENEEVVKVKKIEIDLSEQKMRLYENEIIIKETLISTGKPGMATPVGEFKIENKTKRAWSRMAGLWMPYFMLIEPKKGIGIHELPEWPNGYKEGADHLGKPVSHGCIRLGVGPAEEIYNWVEAGTPVKIQN